MNKPRQFVRPASLIIGLVIFISYLLITRLNLGIRDSFKAYLDTQPSTKLVEIYNTISGQQKPTSTLVLFANNSELRVGGGFIGTVGVLNGSQGKIDLESIRSVYYFDHRMESKSAFISPPQYLLGLTSQIAVRDSLNSVDGNVNARLARDLFARESGIEVDNVIILTPQILQALLEVTGPVSLSDYNLSVTQDNIFDALQAEVEAGKDKQSGKDPKTILGVLTRELIKRAPDLSISQLQRLASKLDDLILTKQLALYSGSNLDKSTLADDQSMKPGSNNSFMVTAANHVANKSSQAIDQEIKAILSINSDGSAELTIDLQVTHNSDYKGQYVDPTDGKEKWLIGVNQSWYDIILPNNSTLISGEGWVKQSKEGVADYGQDIGLKPLESKGSKLKVRLPYNYVMANNLVVDLTSIIQFGNHGQKLTMQIEAPEGYRLVSGPGFQSDTPNKANVTEFQTRDSSNHFVFSK